MYIQSCAWEEDSMTDKELKRLNRTELLQLLMNQVRETEQLQAKVQDLYQGCGRAKQNSKC